MASTKDLRRRIKSIKNTSQITKAMQMVSATKMRRAQNQALSGRPYNQTLRMVLTKALASGQSLSSPLMLRRTGNSGVVILASDKGLCGALNSNLIRFVLNSLLVASESRNVSFISVGKKGRDFVVRTGRNLIADFESQDKVVFREAVKLRKLLVKEFLSGKMADVYLLYPHFINTLKQEPKLLKLLPVVDLLEQTLKEFGEGQVQVTGEFLFEPDLNSLLDFALAHLVEATIYQAMLETKASEHSARMVAMQNATNNAQELVTDLTLTYNGLRQEGITRELLEITSASAALEQN